MDIQTRMELLEKQVKLLELKLSHRSEVIDDCLERTDYLRDRINKIIDCNDKDHKTFQGMLDIVGEKLFTIFYKVFPEAIEADNALERAMKGQRKKPTE